MKDFDPLGIGLVIEEIDIFFDQFNGGLIDSAVKGNGSVAVDFSSGHGCGRNRRDFWGLTSGGEGAQYIDPTGFLSSCHGRFDDRSGHTTVRTVRSRWVEKGRGEAGEETAFGGF